MKRILVVGANFAGATYARTLAESGYAVTVIDEWRPIAGNCFDDVYETGVHVYGPYRFHASNERVLRWLSRFATWTPYQQKVVARLADGRDLPLPVDLDRVGGVFGLSLETAAAVREQARRVSVERWSFNMAEGGLFASIGTELIDLFLRPYTRATWWHNVPTRRVFQPVHAPRTLEGPYDCRDDNLDQYYPIEAFESQYDRLDTHDRKDAKKLADMQFIGRCGTYQHLDMHRVINRPLVHCQKWPDVAEHAN